MNNKAVRLIPSVRALSLLMTLFSVLLLTGSLYAMNGAGCGAGSGGTGDARSVGSTSTGYRSTSPSPTGSPRGRELTKGQQEINELPFFSDDERLDRLKKLIYACIPDGTKSRVKLDALRFPDVIEVVDLPFVPDKFIPLTEHKLELTSCKEELGGISTLSHAINAAISLLELAAVGCFTGVSDSVMEYIRDYPSVSLFPTNDFRIMAIRLGLKKRYSLPPPPGTPISSELAAPGTEDQKRTVFAGIIQIQSLYLVASWMLDQMKIPRMACPLLPTIHTLISISKCPKP